jgi:hypothetical protein
MSLKTPKEVGMLRNLMPNEYRPIPKQRPKPLNVREKSALKKAQNPLYMEWMARLKNLIVMATTPAHQRTGRNRDQDPYSCSGMMR